jgi:hypothetical protein
MAKPMMLPMVELINKGTKETVPNPIKVPQKTSKKSLGDGGNIFSIQVNNRAVINTPSGGNDCINKTIDSIMIRFIDKVHRIISNLRLLHYYSKLLM